MKNQMYWNLQIYNTSAELRIQWAGQPFQDLLPISSEDHHDVKDSVVSLLMWVMTYQISYKSAVI